MNNALQVFRYKEQEVRTVELDGEIWFVAKDVCDILEIVDSTTATRDLDDDEKATHSMRTPGGMQNMTVISEPGVYALVMKSRKPEAKQFSRWVRHEVLLTLHRTGTYSLRPNANISQNDLECASFIYQSAGITGNQLTIALNNMYRTYSGKNALEAGDIVLEAPTKKQLLTPTEIGSHFGLKPHRVNEILAGAGFQHKINGKWEALPDGEQYAVMQDTGKKHSNGTPVRQLKWNSSILDTFKSLIA